MDKDLKQYHKDLCFNLMNFIIQVPHQISFKFYLDNFTDELTKIINDVNHGIYNEGIKIYILNDLENVYYEMYYIHPHNGDENITKSGEIKIDDKLIYEVLSTLKNMAIEKIEKIHKQTIQQSELNKKQEEKNKFEILAQLISQGFDVNLEEEFNNVKQKVVQDEQSVYQRLEQLRDKWSEHALFLEQSGYERESKMLRVCIGELYNEVQLYLKEKK